LLLANKILWLAANIIKFLFKMAPKDNNFLSTITIFTNLYNLIHEEDQSDEENIFELNNLDVTNNPTDEERNFEETISQMENFESSSEDNFRIAIGEEITKTEDETPLTSMGDNQQERNPQIKRLVFAARRLFPSDTEEDESDFEMEYLENTDEYDNNE
jgi:hypothetical protein